MPKRRASRSLKSGSLFDPPAQPGLFDEPQAAKGDCQAIAEVNDEPVISGGIPATRFPSPAECRSDNRDGREGPDGLLFDKGADAGRWTRLDAFNPKSAPQVLKLIAALGHETPQDRWGRITTGKIELERLARKTRHPVYRLILESRELRTLLNNFVGQWEPGLDDRVHPQFMTAPATGQHSSRDPNAQNSPKHTRLAGAFNAMFVAPPGHKFVILDWKSFHVITLAFEARDVEYTRVARIDPHTFVTAHVAKIDGYERLMALPDDELRERLAWIRSCGGGCQHSDVEKREGKCWGYLRDAKVKHSVLGYNLGMGPTTLYYRHREALDGMKEARALLDLMDRLFPKSAAWRRQIVNVAHKQRYLISRWGFLRYFYEVFRPSYSGSTIRHEHGDDYEAAISFYPQNDAHGYRNDVMIRLQSQGLNEKYWLADEVHDDLRFCCREELVEECLHNVAAEMTRPNPVLTDPVVAPAGLWCGVSASVGPSWDCMEGVKVG